MSIWLGESVVSCEKTFEIISRLVWIKNDEVKEQEERKLSLYLAWKSALKTMNLFDVLLI